MDAFFTGGGDLEEGTGVRGHPSALARTQGRLGIFAPSPIERVSRRPATTVTAQWLRILTAMDGLISSSLVMAAWQLFCNRGDGTFDDATDRSGLNDTLWSSSAAAGDVNGDTIPDLYVAHYVDWSLKNNPVCRAADGQRDICPPLQFRGLIDTLYLGTGDETFRETIREAGLRPEGKGLGVLMSDLDLDGDLDVYVTNDTVDNFLYESDGRGGFTEIGAGSGAAFNDRGRPDGSMGVDAGGFYLDGLPDLWVANYEHESFALYRNEGRLLFQHGAKRVASPQRPERASAGERRLPITTATAT